MYKIFKKINDSCPLIFINNQLMFVAQNDIIIKSGHTFDMHTGIGLHDGIKNSNFKLVVILKSKRLKIENIYIIENNEMIFTLKNKSNDDKLIELGNTYAYLKVESKRQS